ncbi:hypothetical protein GCM10027405_37590 [Arthrobacter alkaliphilus]|uniref:hypothetical protein n=1 Tax=Arthrobacter alkaliphilus TaxID=369936 RepID=UPI001F2B08A3|nr:hypothetical protein [Arthrobacter alkaliphilus]
MVVDVATVLGSFRAFEEPKVGLGGNPFKLGCSLSTPASATEIDAYWPGGVPDELRQLWSASRNARLFEDVEYGQWGLVLLSPEDAATRTVEFGAARPNDATLADIVIGEFLGDLDLLVMAADGTGVLVALPLDPREDWYRAAPSMAAFLLLYQESLGEKYWESGTTPG